MRRFTPRERTALRIILGAEEANEIIERNTREADDQDKIRAFAEYMSRTYFDGQGE